MKKGPIIACTIGIMAFSSGCGWIGGEPAPTATPTASPTGGPTATPEYYDGMNASEIEAMDTDVQVTSVPDEFPLDRLPIMESAQNILVDEQPMYIAVSFVVKGSSAAARTFYEEKGATWENVQRLTGDGEWTMQGEADGQMLAVTVGDSLDNAVMVKIVAYYQRDIEESPETSAPDESTPTPAGEGTTDGAGGAEDNAGGADDGAQATPTPEPT